MRGTNQPFLGMLCGAADFCAGVGHAHLVIMENHTRVKYSGALCLAQIYNSIQAKCNLSGLIQQCNPSSTHGDTTFMAIRLFNYKQYKNIQKRVAGKHFPCNKNARRRTPFLQRRLLISCTGDDTPAPCQLAASNSARSRRCYCSVCDPGGSRFKVHFRSIIIGEDLFTFLSLEAR